jgi:hypothetical protein
VKGYRHTVNVMRPTEATDEEGGLQGQDTCVRRLVPCSRKHLGGSKTDQVHSTWQAGTYEFEFYADPLRQVTPRDYLVDPFETRLMNDKTTQNRTFRIEDIQESENGMKLTVIAVERQ